MTSGRTSGRKSLHLVAIANVIDHVGCQLEPRQGPRSVQGSDGSRYQGPQVRKGSDDGIPHGREQETIRAKNSFHDQRRTAAPDEGGMVGRKVFRVGGLIDKNKVSQYGGLTLRNTCMS